MSKICSYVWFILVIVLLLFKKVLSEDSEILAVTLRLHVSTHKRGMGLSKIPI